MCAAGAQRDPRAGGRQELGVRARFKGELKKRGRAAGEFKFVARPPDVPTRGATTRCTFRKLDWKAKRGKEVTIPEPPL